MNSILMNGIGEAHRPTYFVQCLQSTSRKLCW
jgi:hypothetical protein